MNDFYQAQRRRELNDASMYTPFHDEESWHEIAARRSFRIGITVVAIAVIVAAVIYAGGFL